MADEENKEDNEGLLGFTPELGQRVHFVEGTQFPCREDKPKKSVQSEDRLANTSERCM
ncbi:uncharacterized protein LOC143355728 [Halictus rubicundus]|uniref:uncharacterized protein LOC143355728 n=1 Tax=Halictus rubicundus TaxID=77578 RepID=UPI00403736C2